MDTKKAYRTETAAASVAVKIPRKIPPKIRTGINNAQMLSSAIFAVSFAGTFSRAGKSYFFA